MARTLSGNLIGRAAVLERQEEIQSIMDRSQRDRHRFHVQYKWTLRQLKRLDPKGWEKWYDNQPAITCGEMLPIMKARVMELKERQV